VPFGLHQLAGVRGMISFGHQIDGERRDRTPAAARELYEEGENREMKGLGHRSAYPLSGSPSGLRSSYSNDHGRDQQ
jgi:hypothetical protein